MLKENSGIDKSSATSSGEFFPPGFPLALQKLLLQRQINTAEKFQDFLYPQMSRLQDPYTILGMDKAVKRIVQAFLAQEKICIYADFDLDGTSGLALLRLGLEQMGFAHIMHYQPKRLSEGYGFHAHAVDDLKNQNVDLIITVDVGITAHAACARAKELGIDVIITDHHLPLSEKPLPEALVVVNPNQPLCTSKLKYLSGAGVGFYLLRALKREFKNNSQLPPENLDLKSILDFFCIATVTDMVPLIEDNRVLVKHGLQKLANTTWPGLKALILELDLWGRPLTSTDLGMKLAPKLNALSRMENGLLPVDIFLIQDFSAAQNLVQQILQNNAQRVELQSQAEEEALEKLKSWTQTDFVFVSSTNFHRGVIGLVATKLSQKFNKPAFVGSENAEGIIVGSSRLPPQHPACLVTALQSAAGLLQRFGGHSPAAGFEVAVGQVAGLVEQLALHFSQALQPGSTVRPVVCDGDVNIAELQRSWMDWYDLLGPMGVGFAVPIFLFSVQVNGIKELKGGHLKLQLRATDKPQGSNEIEALLFSPSAQQKEHLGASVQNYDVKLLGEVQWNYFAGQKKIQILVKDVVL